MSDKVVRWLGFCQQILLVVTMESTARSISHSNCLVSRRAACLDRTWREKKHFHQVVFPHAFTFYIYSLTMTEKHSWFSSHLSGSLPQSFLFSIIFFPNLGTLPNQYSGLFPKVHLDPLWPYSSHGFLTSSSLCRWLLNFRAETHLSSNLWIHIEL